MNEGVVFEYYIGEFGNYGTTISLNKNHELSIINHAFGDFKCNITIRNLNSQVLRELGTKLIESAKTVDEHNDV